MEFPKREMETDVLVVGGGSAGAMSAIRAKEVDPSKRVTVFEKGNLMYSGTIARGMDALNIVAVPGVSTPELYVESNNISCEGVADAPVVHAMVSRSYELLQKLESWGVCFPKHNGRYETLRVHPKGEFLVSMKEPDLKVILARKVYELGCRVENRVMTFQLLKDSGRVTGAVGLDVRTGEIVVCRAKTVILSCGGLARFSLPTSGYLYGVYDYPGNTGDGWVMAYEAGAALTGLEHTTCYCIIKDISAPLLYITLTRGAKVLNGLGEELKDAHISIKDLVQQYVDDKGPLFIRMKHLPEAKIREVEDILFTTERPVMQRFFEDRGINFRNSDIELFNTEHFLCSGHGMAGLVVNQRGETTVEGLYAAGDVACVPRGHLTGAFTYGEIAAESAVRYCDTAEVGGLPVEQVEKAVDRIRGITDMHGPVSPHEFEYKVRRLITNYLIPPKNDTKLRLGLQWMSTFREQLGSMVDVSDLHWASKVLEIQSIIDTAALSATASLERRESRWGFWHKRTDFPDRDDAQWLKHVVLTRGADGAPEVSYKPVEALP